MSESVFAGYPGQVWATCYQALAWFAGELDGGAAPATSVVSAAEVTFATLRNAANAVSAWQTGAALVAESANLRAVQALPISLDSLTETYFNARIAGTEAAASQISALAPTVSPLAATGMLATGLPAVPDPGYLEWCMGFTGETAPAAIGTSGVVACAAQEATSWLNVAQAVQILQGQNLTQAYDTAARTYRTSNRVASLLSAVSGAYQSPNPVLLSGAIGSFAIGSSPVGIGYYISPLTWNAIVALPAILLSAGVLTSAPNTVGNQQAAAIRYALDQNTAQLAQLLLSLRTPSVGAVSTATLGLNDTLMDLAARNGGDFEQWSQIAAINGLQPPYPGPTNQAVALSGQQLVLPASGTITSGAAVPSYAANVLGTDWDFGPINGPQPVWTGEIPLITGYRNFARAIGRRLQTPIGTLIYHPTFGSRIPGEVGNIMSQNEASRLAAFGAAAINADPRTGAVLSYRATSNGQPQISTFWALVQPIGPGATSVEVNETISPLP
jgi:hypothetical protein